ncbi:DUF2188 domain-containing protein [Cobetia marina]|uniref:DUF2188 domain-containing protein n=1 Tax=Cobetia marina TaxID=28258 RepID=A0ABU9GDY9_COBMA|nr:DUF2188 domain-containing protein [Cobetia marina]MDO6786019.1 DUF2188 domain-containing protein [Cobetia marina]
MSHTIMVIARHGTWLVKSHERKFNTRLFTTQKSAIDFARELAKDIRAELVIQAKVGKIGH